MRYTKEVDLAKRTLGLDYLEAQQCQAQERLVLLQMVGDECLLYAGLFPQAASNKQVKISYFVELGQSAYISISQTSQDLFNTLAIHFVLLMDVLQSIGERSLLLPLEAYELWQEVGSQRAYDILQSYKNQPL